MYELQKLDLFSEEAIQQVNLPKKDRFLLNPPERFWMNYERVLTDNFGREAKKLSKKYRSPKEDLEQ